MPTRQLSRATRLKLFATATVGALAAGGCSGWNDDRGRGDAEIGEVNDAPAHVIEMPDQFRNISVKCIDGTAAEGEDRALVVFSNTEGQIRVEELAGTCEDRNIPPSVFESAPTTNNDKEQGFGR